MPRDPVKTTRGSGAAALLAVAAMLAPGASPVVFAQEAGQDPGQETETLASYDADTVLARFEGGAVSLGDLLVARRALPQRSQEMDDAALYNGLLRLTIERELLAAAAEAEGLADDPLVALEIRAARREILARAYLRRLVAANLTEDALRAEYQRAYVDAAARGETLIREAVLTSEADAQALRTQVLSGVPFAEAIGGSNVFFREDWIGPGDPTTAPVIAETALGLDVGAVSDPVETAFGWHVVQVVERRAVETPSYEAAEPDLRERLARAIRQQELGVLGNRFRLETETAQPPSDAIREDGLLGVDP